jgi:hypothetical protein
MPRTSLVRGLQPGSTLVPAGHNLEGDEVQVRSHGAPECLPTSEGELTNNGGFAATMMRKRDSEADTHGGGCPAADEHAQVAEGRPPVRRPPRCSFHL